MINPVMYIFSKEYRTTRKLLVVIKPLVVGGKRVEAIKKVRSLTGWGLKESKVFVCHHFPKTERPS